ncbi:MAG TPA: hypothetical protein VGP83_06820 [Pyrinomonadaceae bacterium]|nr:hypothetical protein [Pyrinomonadaceae bacterium]
MLRIVAFLTRARKAQNAEGVGYLTRARKEERRRRWLISAQGWSEATTLGILIPEEL